MCVENVEMNDSIKSKKSACSVGLISAAIIGIVSFGLFACGVQSQPGEANSQPPELLRDALRTGSADFDKLASGVAVGAPRLNTMDRSAHGDRVLEIRSTVQNGTDKVLNGLEMAAVLMDDNGNEIRRTVITPINRVSTGRQAGELQTALRPGDSIDTLFVIDGLDRQFSGRNVKIDVTGIRVE